MLSTSWPSVSEWFWFALQALFVCSVQIADDTVRGDFFPANAAAAEGNAHRIILLEQTMHILVEPRWQTAVLHTDGPHGAISGRLVLAGAQVAYTALHLLVPALLAAWIYVRHRSHFGEVRNTFLWTNILALIPYELIPTAPPRLMTRITAGDQTYRIVDSMRGFIGTGHLHGVPLGYNAYSAMPSLHVAWALICSITLLRFGRGLPIPVMGMLYPLLMLLAVVLTGNHWLLDGVGAGLDVAMAYAIALLWEGRKGRRATPVRSAPARKEPWPEGHRRAQEALQ